MRSAVWLIGPQALIGSLASWYYGLRIGFGRSQILHRDSPISMRWIDLLALILLAASLFVIWRQLEPSRKRHDSSATIFRVTSLSMFTVGLILSVVIVWGLVFVPHVPNSFPPWSTGTTLAVTLDCLALPNMTIAMASFAASALSAFSPQHSD